MFVHGCMSAAQGAAHPEDEPGLPRQPVNRSSPVTRSLTRAGRPATSVTSRNAGTVLAVGQGLQRCRLASNPGFLLNGAHHLDDVAIGANEDLRLTPLS